MEQVIAAVGEDDAETGGPPLAAEADEVGAGEDGGHGTILT